MGVVFVIGGKYVADSCDPSDLNVFCYCVSWTETAHSKKYGYQRSHIFDKIVLYLTKSICR